VPALQVVLGGGVDASGKGFIAEKIIKLPTAVVHMLPPQTVVSLWNLQ